MMTTCLSQCKLFLDQEDLSLGLGKCKEAKKNPEGELGDEGKDLSWQIHGAYNILWWSV